MPKIYIVGEAWGEEEEKQGRGFVGPSGHVLNGLLSANGIDRRECVVDNVFNLRPPGNDVEQMMTKEELYAYKEFPPYKPKMWLRKENAHHLHDLRARIEAERPNLVLALGNTPLWACAGVTGIKKWRGSPMLCSFGQSKLLATWHPAAILRQWNLRPIAFMDIAKAKREAETPELKRPERFIHFHPTLQEIEDFYLDHVLDARVLGCDIETKGRFITEVGFATSPSRAIVIPFFSRAQKDGNYWRTFDDERAAWGWVRRFCAEKPLVGQNFSYDAQYLWKEAAIPTPNWAGDTMLMHHSLQPELEKGLGFLGSIYTDEPAWKFMRQSVETLKRED